MNAGGANDEDNDAIEDFLIKIKKLDDYKLYLTNVLTQQLDGLINSKANVYDIETYDEKKLFNYMLALWKLDLIIIFIFIFSSFFLF